MGVEGSDNFNSALIVFWFIDEYLFADVEIALEGNGFHAVVLLELRLVLSSPEEGTSVLGRDINWFF